MCLSTPKAPPPPRAPPEPEDPEIQKAADDRRAVLRLARGRSETNVTGGLGDVSERNIRRRALVPFG